MQIEWIKQDLEKAGKETRVVVSTHIPLLSVGAQVMVSPNEGPGRGSVVTNADVV